MYTSYNCTNSMPQGNPNIGCSEEGHFIQCKQLIVIQQDMEQQGCEEALGLDRSTLARCWGFSSSQENNLHGKWKVGSPNQWES